jgi:peptidyl-prolyl cis-trans isomerase C
MTVVLENVGKRANVGGRDRLPRPGPVSVDGRVIARDAIARETQNHPAAKPAEAWAAAARALVVRELLLAEARRRAIAPTPDVDEEGRRETDDEAAIRGLLERAVEAPEADMEACQRFFAQNAARFRTEDLSEVRHILLAVAPDDPEGRAAARKLAQEIIDGLAGQLARFAEVAKRHSVCPSRDVGGSLGQIGRGQTVPEFEAALRSLPVGDVAPEPVETRYGLHVVLVERRIEGRALPFEAVQPRIAAWLGERARRTALKRYIAGLADRATITGIEFEPRHAETTP